MRYEDVYSNEELNQKVNDYLAVGYTVENRISNYARLVKDDFSWGVFVILLFLLIIGALIYWAFKSGKKDEIIIRVKDNVNHDNAVNYCVKCGTINEEEFKFCGQCGNRLKSTKTQKLDVNKISCPFCGEKISVNTGKCNHCGEWIDPSKDDYNSRAISLGYVISIFCGWLGLIPAVYLITRGTHRSKKHGYRQLIISLLSGWILSYVLIFILSYT